METSRSRSVFPVDCCGESPMETSRSRAVPDEDGHVRGNFYVRCTPSLVKSFRTSLAFALESRKGTAEEVESELNLKFDPEVLNLTEDDLVEKFASGVLTITSLSLAISYPALAAAPHMFLNAYKNVLAVALATEYSFPQAENVKEFIKDPSKFALAVAATVSGECGGAAEAVAVEEEVAEESDGDMGFDLFG